MGCILCISLIKKVERSQSIGFKTVSTFCPTYATFLKPCVLNYSLTIYFKKSPLIYTLRKYLKDIIKSPYQFELFYWDSKKHLFAFKLIQTKITELKSKTEL